MAATRVKVEFEPVANIMTFAPVSGDASFVLDLGDVFPGLIENATKLGEPQLFVTLYGIRQFFGDKYADKTKVPDDAIATRLAQIAEAAKNGEMKIKGVGSDGVGRSTDLHEALAQLYPDKTPEQVAKVVKDKGKAGRATLKKHPTIVSIIEDIKKKRQDAKTKAAKSAATETEDALDLDFG